MRRDFNRAAILIKYDARNIGIDIGKTVPVNAMNAYGKVEVSSTNSFLGHRWR
jgi:hypothetical protein